MVQLQLNKSTTKMTKCPLHLATNLKELDVLVAKCASKGKLEILCRVSDKLYRRAIAIQNTDPLDEEMLYIICIRYLNLVHVIKKQVNDNNFHNTRFSKFIAEIENIRDKCGSSLSVRYDQNIQMAPIKESIADAIEEINVNIPRNNLFIKDNEMFVDVQTFFKLITNPGLQILIMDIRSPNDFKDSSLKYPSVLNIPEDVIRKGLSTNTLQQCLTGENIELFKTRHKCDVLVLMDIETTRVSYRTSKIESLRTILIEWDIEDKYHSLPIVLDGGIRAFVDHYPTLVNNPEKILNKMFNMLDDLMDDIEYPDVLNPDKPPESPISEEQPELNLMPSDVDISTKENEVPSLPISSTSEDYQSISIVQNIITVAEYQVEIENKLLNFAEQRLRLIKGVATKHGMKEDISLQLQEISKEVSKVESLKIQLDDRRTKIDAAYEHIKMSTDDENLQKMLQTIKRLDEERLLYFQKRKNIERQEEEFNKVINFKAITHAAHYPVSIDMPQVPDRKSKPSVDMGLKQIEYLSKKFKNTGLTGLSNIKNTCYLNSLIQCLRFCPIIIYHYFNNLYTLKTPLNYHFAEIIRKSWVENRVAIRPGYFYEEVCRQDQANENKGYVNGCHEDVQEFYIFLTKMLNEEISVPINLKNVELTDKLRDWVKMSKGQTSFIDRASHYQIEFTTTCPRCNKSLIKYDYGNTVFISCPDDGVPLYLDNRVRNYTSTTTDEQKACRFCTKCEVQMVLRKRISYYPAVLAVNIVRYDFSKIEQCILRRDNHCVFQTEVQFGNCKYSLKSISLHSGNRDVGHYTALCLHPFLNKWIEFNDEHCKFVNVNDPIYKVKSYMFFYTLTQNFEEVNKNFFPA